MKIITAQIKSVSPYSQSKHIEEPKKDKEGPNDYEKRTWRERIHADDKGMVYIPAMALKNSLAEAAKYLSEKIPGKGNATWTKHFEAGVIVDGNAPIGIKKDDVPGEWLFLNADGKRGGGTRVSRCMPYIQQWQTEANFLIVDDTITKDIFDYHLKQAGQIIGIGRFRPRNGGFYGRFEVLKTTEVDA